MTPPRLWKRLFWLPIGCALALPALLPASAAEARENLGIYESWGAFRDPNAPRCYAIAMAAPSPYARDYQPYATIGTWPKQGLRNQVHFRLSRELQKNARIVLQIGGRRFVLTGGGGDSWAKDRQMDAAIVAAIRSAENMTVYARDAKGRRFSDRWPLSGAATAMDAATVACAKLR